MRPFNYGPRPPSWRSTKLRWILRRSRAVGEGAQQLLSVNLPSGVVVRGEGLDERPAPSEDTSAYLAVSPGQLVVNPLGKPHGSLGVSDYSGIISPAYFVTDLDRSEVHPRFLHYLLRTRLYISEYERRGKWMPPSQFNISWDQFRDIGVVLPPMEVQLQIVSFLDSGIDGLYRKLGLMARPKSSSDGSFAAVLANYRESLITEAVTGQIDVASLSDARMDEQAHAALEGATEAVEQDA